MAAPTTIQGKKLWPGELSVARVTPSGAATTALVAAVTGKKVWVLAVYASFAAAGTQSLRTGATDVLIAFANTTAINLPLQMTGVRPNEYVVITQTTVSEALNLAHAGNGEITVVYVQD